MTHARQFCREPRRIFGRREDRGRWRWRFTHVALVAALALVALGSVWQIFDSLPVSRAACVGCGSETTPDGGNDSAEASAPGAAVEIRRRR